MRPLYDDWLWYEKHFDMAAMSAGPEFVAHCYILDGNRKRVQYNGRTMTCNRILTGQTEEEAIETLDTDSYEFIRWL